MGFKAELRDLMLKHNVDAIYWSCDRGCSDTHGIYDEKMIISFSDDTDQIEIEGGCISLSDLK